MEAFRPPKPLSVDSNIHNNWKQFKQSYNIFITATGRENKTKEVKAAILLNLIGEEGLELFNTFDLQENQEKDVDAIIKAFDDYINPRRNIIYERFLFYNRNQKEGEDFEHYLTELTKLSKSCEFSNNDEALRDRIVLGINKREIQERLLRTSDLTLQAAITTCRASEISKLQMQVMVKQENVETEAITKHQKNMKSERVFPRAQTQPNMAVQFNWRKENRAVSPQSKYHCKKCDKWHKAGQCFAYGKKCTICNKFNHFATGCKYKKSVREITENDDDSSNDSKDNNTFGVNHINETFDINNDNSKIIAKLTNVESINKSMWVEDIKIENKLISCKLDTGSEVNVINKNNLWSYVQLKPCEITLQAFGGFKIKPLGKITLKCETKNVNKYLEFIVVDKNNTKTIIGLDGCIKLKLVKRTDSISENYENVKEKFLTLNEDVFNGLGSFPIKYSIKIDNSMESSIKPPRRVPHSITDKLKETLKNMEQQKIIKRVDKPKQWASNLVIVEKGNKLRICLDPRDLNKAIKREYFLIPTFAEIRTNLINKTIFTVIDLKDGFWQIPLDKKSSEICTFSTPFGYYRFKRLPFGLSCAPEVFQKMNQNYFGDIKNVSIYIDDILIAASNEIEHDEALKLVIERARKFNIKFNKTKLQYKQERIKYLGHIFDKNGVMPDPEQVGAINCLDIPNNRVELQRILGMVNYFRDFIPNLSSITEPMRNLLKKKKLVVMDRSTNRSI